MALGLFLLYSLLTFTVRRGERFAGQSTIEDGLLIFVFVASIMAASTVVEAGIWIAGSTLLIVACHRVLHRLRGD